MVDQLITELGKAAAAGDLLACRHLLEGGCAAISSDAWRRYEFRSFEEALPVYEVLVETELCNSVEGSPLRVLFLRVNDYVVANAQPEQYASLSGALAKLLPELYTGPVAFDKNGGRCFSVEALAQAFGVEVDEVVDVIRECEAAGLPAPKAESITVHTLQ